MLVIHPGPYPGAPAHLSTPKVLQTKERAPTPSPSVVFTFGFTIESIKESRGASTHLHRLSSSITCRFVYFVNISLNTIIIASFFTS
jgi:hypothetical protein